MATRQSKRRYEDDEDEGFWFWWALCQFFLFLGSLGNGD